MKTALELYQWAQVDQIDTALIQMERNGFMLDVPYINQALARAHSDEQEILAKLKEHLKILNYDVPLNPASPVQLVRLLHDHLGLPPSPVWKKGKVKLHEGVRKTDEVALDWLSGVSSGSVKDVCTLLVQLRRVRGSIKYLTKLPTFIAPDGFVHPVCGPAGDHDPRAGTITWRLASKNPEVQQIPQNPRKDLYKIRKGFIAPPGYTLIAADYRALEMVILAHLFATLFDDYQLAEMVAPGAPDPHAVNARRVFGTYLGWERADKPGGKLYRVDHYPPEAFKSEDYPDLVQLREDIKTVWYKLMYGGTAYSFGISFRDKAGNPIGQEAAERIVEAIYAAIPALRRYDDFVLDYVTRHHGIVGLSGAWCDLSALTQTSNKWELARAVRIAKNYPCQEGGARIVGAAICAIHGDPGLYDCALERQIHDELDFRVPLGELVFPKVEKIKRHMISYPLKVPLQVSIGTGANWDEAKHHEVQHAA